MCLKGIFGVLSTNILISKIVKIVWKLYRYLDESWGLKYEWGRTYSFKISNVIEDVQWRAAAPVQTFPRCGTVTLNTAHLTEAAWRGTGLVSAQGNNKECPQGPIEGLAEWVRLRGLAPPHWEAALVGMQGTTPWHISWNIWREPMGQAPLHTLNKIID